MRSPTQSGSALLAGITPVFGEPTRTADGFTFTVTNFDADASYGLVATDGSVSMSGSTVTVTGLAAAAGSLVTVTVSQTEHVDAVAAAVGHRAGCGDGAGVLGGDPARRWLPVHDHELRPGADLHRAGRRRHGDARRRHRDGLRAGRRCHLGHHGDSREGGLRGRLGDATGNSLPNGTAPVASASPVPPDGYSFTITLVPGTSYAGQTSDAGTVTLSGSTVTVSGLPAGATTTVHVTASTPDALDATTDVSGSALLAGVSPLFGAPTRTADGYSFSVTNFDAAGSYALVAADGSATMSGSTVTVTGLAPDAASTVTVTALARGACRRGRDGVGQCARCGNGADVLGGHAVGWWLPVHDHEL
jgi:phosphotransferase system HPr-like phosphotransfer protein